MSDIQRYTLDHGGYMDEVEDGKHPEQEYGHTEYVTHSDHLKAMQAAQAEIAILREQLE